MSKNENRIEIITLSCIAILGMFARPMMLKWVFAWLVAPALHLQPLAYWTAFGICWCVQLTAGDHETARKIRELRK